ncbi:9055_t:CDS:2 [Funneliformis caledonium]|uniref:9055_t:CDS:1 n=1 Tax=Funneliformis caledonium TaxID=1117310 RepID=A0A9N9IDU3_9GLOM|nr:9055_t:CDS:2 [Funneliformis caledonium]
MLIDKENNVDNANKEAFYFFLDQHIEEDCDIDNIVNDVLIMTGKDEQPENSDDDSLVTAN